LNLVVREYQNLEVFDEVEASGDGRFDYDNGVLTVAYADNSDTAAFVAAKLSVDNETVTLPDGSVVLEVSGDSITALVPKEAY